VLELVEAALDDVAAPVCGRLRVRVTTGGLTGSESHEGRVLDKQEPAQRHADAQVESWLNWPNSQMKSSCALPST
jgi:hypothetical protein